MAGKDKGGPLVTHVLTREGIRAERWRTGRSPEEEGREGAPGRFFWKGLLVLNSSIWLLSGCPSHQQSQVFMIHMSG